MNKKTSRRRFLRHAVGASLAMGLPLGAMRAIAQQTGEYRALVCLYLFGGNDADNLIVPLAGSPAHVDYVNERTGVLDASQTALSLGAAPHTGYGQSIDWGVHSAMPNLAGLWHEGKAAAVANVGTLVEPMTQATYRAGNTPRPMRLFSHSDQQAQSQNASPSMQVSSGWGGRIADRVVDDGYNSNALFPTAASFSGNPVMVAGEQAQAATLSANYRLSLLGNYGTVASRNAAMEALLARDTGQPLLTRANRRLLDTLELGRQVEAARQSAPPLVVPFPETGIGRQLRNVAELVSLNGDLGTDRQVFFVSLGGFDTHAGQAAPHARLLGQVDDALGAFYDQLTELSMAHAVTTFTMSDFGRTFQVNGNVGTDHAWGAHHFVIGEAVNSGFYGDFPTLQRNGPDSTDGRGRWIPTTGLDQYGATLARWLGVQAADLTQVFPNLPNFPTDNLGFMRL